MSAFTPRAEFAHADGFLHALLGVVALSLEVDRMTAVVEAEPPHAHDAPRDPGADAVLEAMLGIVHLRRELVRAIESWAREGERSGGAPPEHVTTPEPTEEPQHGSLWR